MQKFPFPVQPNLDVQEKKWLSNSNPAAKKKHSK